MSGSGPSGDEGGGGGNNATDCSLLTGRGTIMSPDPAVLALLTVNEFLDISLSSVTGPLQGFKRSGELVGNIFLAGSLSAEFITCINSRFEYKGKVTSLSGGLCELLIIAK